MIGHGNKDMELGKINIDCRPHGRGRQAYMDVFTRVNIDLT